MMGLIKSALKWLPGAGISAIANWPVILALLAGLAASHGAAAMWGYSKGAAGEKAACEALDAARLRAQLEAIKDADLLAASVAAEANRERGPAEVLDRLGKGTF